MKPVEVTDQTFQEVVLKSPIPAFVDFWAPWCGPCRMVAPVVEELASEYVGKVRFVKMNTDENFNTAMSYGIRGIPTMIIFRDGKEAGRIVGFMPKPELKKRVDAVLAPVAKTQPLA
jgi:thioredoxin 1